MQNVLVFYPVDMKTYLIHSITSASQQDTALIGNKVNYWATCTHV